MLDEKKEIKKEIIAFIYYCFIASNNLQADFNLNKDEFFHIDENFELFIKEDKNQNSGSAILFEASRLVENILKILDEKDFLFNYLSLFKNDITLNLSGNPCYDFTKPTRFSSLKKYLK